MNACYDHLRTRKVHGDVDALRHDSRAVLIDTYEQAELGHQLEQTLARLSERHRTVLLLKDVHGLHHDEIAAILGVSRGATETLLFRARAAFREQYATLTPELPVARCDLARRAAVAAVGGTLRASERRKIMVHAQTCPDCRETVKTWGIAVVGLGLFLHSAPLPAALQTPFSYAAAGGAGAGGAGAGGAGAGGAGAGGTAAASGAGVSGAAGAGGGSAGVAAAGGLAAKVGALVATKIVVVALAATVATVGAGVTAYQVHAAHVRAKTSAADAALVESGSAGGARVAAGGSAGQNAAAKSNPGTHGKSAVSGAANKANNAKSHSQGKAKGGANGQAKGKAKGGASVRPTARQRAPARPRGPAR